MENVSLPCVTIITSIIVTIKTMIESEVADFLKRMSLVDWRQVLMSDSDMHFYTQYHFTKFLVEAK